MNSLLEYTSFFLVGIKGVAMTSLAQCLLDAGKKVMGSDVAEDFVTKRILKDRHIPVSVGFDTPIPSEIECVIYTGAHKGPHNPQVLAAQAAGIPTFSQAEAVATLFNHKKGIAVCGVGGKSTTSAMITWILEKTGRQPSYSVGVGSIIGLPATGRWQDESEFFVAEADEYVIDPHAPAKGEPITPRFSFMKPYVTVCTNLLFDHPDVYQNPEHTYQVFNTFFTQIKAGGTLLTNQANHQLIQAPTQASWLEFSTTNDQSANFHFVPSTFRTDSQGTQCDFSYPDPAHPGQSLTATLRLKLPGMYNLANALAAVGACYACGIPIEEALTALTSFQSTQRRFECVGTKHGVTYYDDYAHHPNEIAMMTEAVTAMFASQRVVFAFQPHTYSRTKALFSEFVTALSSIKELVLLDIFASAREGYDDSISSSMIRDALLAKNPSQNVSIVSTVADLASLCQTRLKPGDICVTVGAGDIYQVHELLQA
jgi:UDP-N-acetylmuramate--alanine ligase